MSMKSSAVLEEMELERKPGGRFGPHLFPVDSSKYYQPMKSCTELDREVVIMGKGAPIIFFFLIQIDCIRMITSLLYFLSCVRRQAAYLFWIDFDLF